LDAIYPSDVILEGNVLKIKMIVPTSAFFYENNTIIVRELSVYSIKNYIEDVNKIIFTCHDTASSEANPLKEASLYTKEEINNLISFNNTHSTAFDFKKYILDNIDGDDQYELYGVILAIYELDKKSTENVPDYVEVIINYAREVEKNKLDTPNLLLLKKIRSMVMENRDLVKKVEIEDVDYFLNYNKKPR